MSSTCPPLSYKYTSILVIYSGVAERMESVDLDMGEIFDDERADDDDIGAISALPDLPEYGEDEPDGEQGDGDNEDAGKDRFFFIS